MAVDVQTVDPAVKAILEALNAGYWTRVDFWISTVIGVAGVVLSGFAFREAHQAKQAATAAGRTVKIQTVTIELSEISQKLVKLETKIEFPQARDLLNEISQRLRRQTAPFAQDPALEPQITLVRNALDAAANALNTVRPLDPASDTTVPGSVYYAMEASFRQISSAVADLVGLMEAKTTNFGG